jgi:multidrug efflux pump subunit AcrB
VLSVFIVIAGLAAMRAADRAVPRDRAAGGHRAAIYPGASAEVIEQTVAAPLENAINGVEGMIYMNSTSTSNGVVEIQVTFEIGTDVDKAALNVNNRVKQAEARLPQEVRRQGVTVEKGSSSFLQVLAFYSPDGRYDDLYTSNYVTLNVLDGLKRVPGTTNVQIFGAKDYAMRVWLKPDRMAQLKRHARPTSRARSTSRTRSSRPARSASRRPPAAGDGLHHHHARAAVQAAEFENIIVRSNADGSPLRLRDVARIELGAKDYDFNGT